MNFFRRGFYFSPDEPAGGAAPPAGGGQAPPSGENQPKTYDEAYVTKLRNEAAEHRVKSKDYETKLKAIEDSQKTELQNAEDRAAAAEAERDRAKSENGTRT